MTANDTDAVITANVAGLTDWTVQSMTTGLPGHDAAVGGRSTYAVLTTLNADGSPQSSVVWHPPVTATTC